MVCIRLILFIKFKGAQISIVDSCQYELTAGAVSKISIVINKMIKLEYLSSYLEITTLWSRDLDSNIRDTEKAGSF